MKQYLDLLNKIQKKGTYKPAARENMPGTYSLFGEQMRFDLQEGFPMVTTKKVSFKNIVVELLWFLKGDTNIKYLVDNGCNIWNEDAFNYYLKRYRQSNLPNLDFIPFDNFVHKIKIGDLNHEDRIPNYKLGDCGKQYGWLWRRWETGIDDSLGNYYPLGKDNCGYIDQLKDLIEGLKTNPMSRRHIITAWNPATLDDMALNACHAFVQFNCRPLTEKEQYEWVLNQPSTAIFTQDEVTKFINVNTHIVPKYHLDCQLYQRSADVVLGVPYNIASYALLTEIIAKICNMIPGEFVHTFGDVHIYEDHWDAVTEQLQREPKELPKLLIDHQTSWVLQRLTVIDSIMKKLEITGFSLENYNPHPKLKAETKLSTGL